MKISFWRVDVLVSHVVTRKAKKMEDVVASFTLDPSQLSAQLRSIHCGAYKRLRYFVQEGYDVNAATGHLKMRPLMVACFIKDLKRRIIIVNYLLQNGADPSFTDKHGRNSLIYACSLSRGDVVSRMLRYADFDLNAVDSNGNTALHICAAVGNSKIFKMVLDAAVKHKLNLWTRNKYFCSPWDIAYSKQHLECLSLLRDVGNFPSLCDTAPIKSSTVISRDSLIPLPVHLSLEHTDELDKTNGVSVDNLTTDLKTNTNAITTLFSGLTVVQKSSSYCSPSKRTTPIDHLWVKSIMDCKKQESSPVDLDKLGLLKRIPSCDKTRVFTPKLLYKRAITSPRLPTF